MKLAFDRALSRKIVSGFGWAIALIRNEGFVFAGSWGARADPQRPRPRPTPRPWLGCERMDIDVGERRFDPLA